LPDGIPIPYRAVDIEFSGVNDDDERTYAIIAVINAGFAATGFTDWWARFDMTQSEILFFQQTLGRILDLEIQNGREADDPRWDAIFIPWDEDRPVYNHVASLASPTYSDPSRRGSIPRDFTDDFDPEVNDFEFDLPGLTAGFRLTDIEYYYIFDFSFGFDAFIKADGTFVDAATPSSSSPATRSARPRPRTPFSPPKKARSTWPRSVRRPMPTRSRASTPRAAPGPSLPSTA
jgi:hypothetical protein